MFHADAAEGACSMDNKNISYGQFVEWCNKRCCDGMWGTVHAITSIEIIDSMKKIWFWRRKREWNSKWKKIASQIVSEVEEIRKSYFELDSMDSYENNKL